MARVQEKKITWRCSMQCLYEEPPRAQFWESPKCERRDLLLRPQVWLPGLVCEKWGDISVDEGGGTMCEGRFLDRRHKSCGKKHVWLLAKIMASPRGRLPDYPPEVSNP